MLNGIEFVFDCPIINDNPHYPSNGCLLEAYIVNKDNKFLLSSHEDLGDQNLKSKFSNVNMIHTYFLHPYSWMFLNYLEYLKISDFLNIQQETLLGFKIEIFTQAFQENAFGKQYKFQVSEFNYSALGFYKNYPIVSNLNLKELSLLSFIFRFNEGFITIEKTLFEEYIFLFNLGWELGILYSELNYFDTNFSFIANSISLQNSWQNTYESGLNNGYEIKDQTQNRKYLIRHSVPFSQIIQDLEIVTKTKIEFIIESMQFLIQTQYNLFNKLL